MHALLLELQQQLLWQMVSAKLESEASLGAAMNNFTFSLSKKVVLACIALCACTVINVALVCLPHAFGTIPLSLHQAVFL